jgi:hypothetical protein
MSDKYKSIFKSCPTKNIKSSTCYQYQIADDTVFLLQMFYIFMALFWVLLIAYFDLWREKLSFVLFLPLFAFFITFLCIENVSVYVEESMLQSNFLSLGLILALPMLSWMLKEYNGNKRHFFTVIILALVLSLLTFVDIWVPENRLTLYRHFRSSLQVMSVSLFIFALCTFFFYSYVSLPIGANMPVLPSFASLSTVK